MLENRGDIAIDLSFEKLDSSASTTASFFFDKTPFRLIPSKEVLEISLHFYPIETGLFCEKWRLKCEPHEQHQIVINLIGYCKRKHSVDDEVAKLDAEITRRAGQFTALREVGNIIDLSMPKCHDGEDYSSLVDPIEAKFKEKNPNLSYHPSIVDRMSQLHHQLHNINNSISREWNYDVDALYKHIMNIHDNDEMQKNLYRQFNDAYLKLLTQKCFNRDCDTKVVKISMIKSLFSQFFNRFEYEMNESDDLVNSVAKNLVITINKMISILET